MVGVVAAMAAGCGGGDASATAATPPWHRRAPAAAAPRRPAANREPETSKALPPIAYEPKGRRDPFTPIFVGKDNAGLSVSAVKLTGVVGGGGGLMALVEAPDGIGYILKPGDVLGDGRVTGITQPRSRSRWRPRPAERRLQPDAAASPRTRRT